MYDVSALGELLVDFTPAGISEYGNALYERNAGGAPANVVACLSKLGRNTAYISKVGTDTFGTALKKTLTDFGVDTKGIKTTAFYPTTMAFVSLDEKGERSFDFFRNNTADVRLTPGEVDMSIIEESKIFCYGSVSMTGEPCCAATVAAAERAKQAGKIVCYDPNLRLSLWENEIIAKDSILRGMQYATILKVSEEELEFITHSATLHEGARKLLKEHNLSVVIVTRGAGGAYCLTLSYELSVPTYRINVVDTTGAGDSFVGGFLYKLLEFAKEPDKLSIAEMMICLDFANAVGSMTTTKRGAMTGLPTLEMVYECMRNTPKLAE